MLHHSLCPILSPGCAKTVIQLAELRLRHSPEMLISVLTFPAWQSLSPDSLEAVLRAAKHSERPSVFGGLFLDRRALHWPLEGCLFQVLLLSWLRGEKRKITPYLLRAHFAPGLLLYVLSYLNHTESCPDG